MQVDEIAALIRGDPTNGSNQVGHIHGHLLHGRVVERLDVTKGPRVIPGDEVDRNSFPAETTATTNSGGGKKKKVYFF